MKPLKNLFILIFFVFSDSLWASELTLRERLQGKTVGAHQGGAISLSANTIKRFEHAYKLGVDIVEMDLQVTKDGIVVISHDNKLNPMSNCTGLISDKSWVELKNCRHFYLYKLSTFEEVLQWSNGKVVINAEFKTLGSIKPALDLIKKYDAYNWVFFQAKGDPERYKIAREYDKDVALLFVVSNEESLSWVINLADDNLVVVEVNERTHSEYYINALHAANKIVLEDSWHYSKARELFGASCGPLFRKNIDIAITDKPKSCLTQRETQRLDTTTWTSDQ